MIAANTNACPLDALTRRTLNDTAAASVLKDSKHPAAPHASALSGGLSAPLSHSNLVDHDRSSTGFL